MGVVELRGKFEANIIPSPIFKLNCGLFVDFGTLPHCDSERSRVGLQFAEVDMRLTPFWEAIMRLICLFLSIVFQFIGGLAK